MKKIKAYFENETDAQNARNKLQSLTVEDGMLEDVPDGRNISDIAGDLFSGEKHHKDPRMVEADVSDDDYDKAHSILREHNGRVR
ncbi:hypothetical protein ACOJQI_03340 [Bacillus salacetis]|uniref:hypothetical protein n=1 Tax=Bacillus salacetis TaxID=2315464 RepID=UPI003BA2C637